jgi:hypothetical protein
MIDTGAYVTFEETPKGLIVELTPEGREELAEREPGIDHHVFVDLIEDFLGNGWTLIRPEEIGALTACEVILSPDAEHDDHGNLVACETVFWHANYQVEDLIEALLEGPVTLPKGD